VSHSPPARSSLTEAELDQRCLDAALRFLAARPRSEQEIRRRLTEKGQAPDRIDRVIARLRELQLADDRAFADFWLENRALHRPRGARALKVELLQKGVARDVVDQAIDPTHDESEDAYRAAGRRAATLSILDERQFRQRLAQFLQRRGFGWESIEPVVERLWRERTAPD
jgi:regulatory protein